MPTSRSATTSLHPCSRAVAAMISPIGPRIFLRLVQMIPPVPGVDSPQRQALASRQMSSHAPPKLKLVGKPREEIPRPPGKPGGLSDQA
jgi:hypothetical protein